MNMSEFLAYIKVEPFVRQWLVNHFGDPVTFPPQSIENATIRTFLRKLPPDKIPEQMKEGEVRIRIPDSKQKPVQTFNYLGPHAKMAVAECMEDTFKRNMWAELNDMHDCGCTVYTAICAWCENHGIDLDYSDTIRQRYYRMRDAYLRRGVDLRHKKRNKE